MRVKIYTRPTNTEGKRQYVPADPAKKNAQGTFYLRYTLHGKRVWETTHTQTYTFAMAAAREKEAQLLRQEAAPKPVKKAAERTLTVEEAIGRYLVNVSTKSDKTSSGYKYTLDQFLLSCDGSKPLTDVSKQDLYNFVGYMRREGLSDRTIHNRIGEVVTFLRHFGVKEVNLRVKYVEKKVRSYRPDELKALFAATTPDEWLLFQFFLCTGVREQEAMNAEWGDVDFVDSLFTVKAKPGWAPKDYEEREIPIPDFLVAALKKRLLESKGKLIFPTKEGKREGHMLRKLQDLAKRAMLPGEWGLHKFRKTYATLQHKAGVDARTIQKRLGHSDLTTTLAYLEGEDSRSDRSRKQVNDTFGQFAAV